MAVFYDIVTMQTRLPPSEVERRLQQVSRKRRTPREVLQGRPVNPPTDPDFIGWVEHGRFALTRRVLAPDDLGYSYIHKGTVRGRIVAAETGSRIRLFYCDPALALMTIGWTVASVVVVLGSTGGWPPWRAEHALIPLVAAPALWFCSHSLNTDIAEGTRLIGGRVNALSESQLRRQPRT